MKKFLAVFDGYNMANSTLSYAIQLSSVSGAHLVGVFLDEFVYRSYDVEAVIKKYGNYDQKMKEFDAADKKKRDAAAVHFEQACSKAGLKFSIHRDKGFAINELKRESMFADLIMINESETFTRYKQASPTRFMRDLLGDVQCPVLVVPGKFREVDKIVLLYDGSPACLHAIKMFSYLFRGLEGIPVDVFTVKAESRATTRLPENKLMREFVKRHFPGATYTIVKGTPEEQITGHLRNHKENELVVLGAYQRTEISRWFKPSMGDVLMKELDTPLFIAHK